MPCSSKCISRNSQRCSAGNEFNDAQIKIEMRMITRNAAGSWGVVVAIALCTAVTTAHADEALTEITAEARTVLAFQLGAGRAKELLPTGWQVAPAGTGPLAGANLMLILIDQSARQSPECGAVSVSRHRPHKGSVGPRWPINSKLLVFIASTRRCWMS
jgi:hypothetical protein